MHGRLGRGTGQPGSNPTGNGLAREWGREEGESFYNFLLSIERGSRASCLTPVINLRGLCTGIVFSHSRTHAAAVRQQGRTPEKNRFYEVGEQIKSLKTKQFCGGQNQQFLPLLKISQPSQRNTTPPAALLWFMTM